MNPDDLAFAKIVTDSMGVDHMLIAGRIYTFAAPPETNNELVDVITRALRRGGTERCTQAASTSAVIGSVQHP